MVNAEKMSMMAAVLRRFRNCKASAGSRDKTGKFPVPDMSTQIHSFIRNFHVVIDNQKKLMALSYEIEP